MAADAFGKFKDSVNRGITTISVKTSSSLEKSKIKMHMDNLQKEIDQLYFEAGKNAYDLWESRQLTTECFEETFRTIRQKREEIEQLLLQSEEIDSRDRQILGVRQAAPGAGAADAATAAAVGIVCPNCGAQYEEPVRFCRKCGQNLQNI